MKNIGLILLFFLVFIGVGCSNDDSPQTITVIDNGYPLEGSDSTIDAYPVSEIPEEENEVVAQLENNNSVTEEGGGVSGFLILNVNGNQNPVTDTRLYLAEVLIDDSGSERAAGYDRIESPTAVTDNKGKFVFQGIKPGRYGLVLDTIMNSYLLSVPGQTEGLIITVIEGETTNIGDLVYDELPLTDQQ